MLLNRIGQLLDQTDPPAHPAHAPTETTSQLFNGQLEALAQLAQEPPLLDRAVALGRLHGCPGADDQALGFVDLSALVVGFVGIQLDAVGAGEHLGGHVLHVVATLAVREPEAVVLGDVPVGLLVGGNGQSYTRASQSVRLVGPGLGDDAMGDAAGNEHRKPHAARDDFASGGIDATDPYEIEWSDARGAQGFLERL